MTSPLVAAVAAWCEPRRMKVLREPVTDDSWWVRGELCGEPPEQVTGAWAQIRPLVEDLQQAVAPSGEAGRGGGRGTGGPVDWDAVAILDGLRAAVSAWTQLAGLQHRADLAGGLRQLAVHGWLPDGPDPDQLAAVLARLAARATAHLTPPDVAPTRYVRLDCPACGAREVTASLDGDLVRGFALVVEFNRGFVNSMGCQVCGAYWTRHQLEQWAARGVAVPA